MIDFNRFVNLFEAMLFQYISELYLLYFHIHIFCGIIFKIPGAFNKFPGICIGI